MSLTSISSLSFNTLSKHAIGLLGIDKGFQTILKRKDLIVFRDNSFIGRAIHQCLDISHYVFGTVLFLSSTFQMSASSRIAAAILVLPVPLFCKAICQMASSESATYQFSDHVVQVVRVGVKFAFAIAAIKQPGAQFLEIVRATGFVLAFIVDACTTLNYLMSNTRDFYIHLRWSYP
jgi:hypothetical protein